MITLDSNPSDAPCCVKIINDDGRDTLIQTDLDFPSVATTFGFSLVSVQNVPAHYSDWQQGRDCTPEENKACEDYENRKPCDHQNTDGTVNCSACGVTASAFIQAARQWLDDHDGGQAEDPGYFEQ